MAKTIAVIATLDTKGEEAQFLRRQIEARGHRVVLIDTGILGDPTATAEFTRDDVARAAGATSIDEVRACDQKRVCLEKMIEGATEIVTKMVNGGEVHGVIGLGGGSGTSIGTAVMRAQPFGLPKLMVSTVASGKQRFGPFVGLRDLMMMHSVADILGLNPIMRQVLANAAGAICGMVEVEPRPGDTRGPVVFATMFGNTTPCIMHARSILVGDGYEVVIFHPNGTGGPAMEELIGLGAADGVLDLAAHEVSGELFGGIMGAPHRLEAAGRLGVPQVVGPGGNDYLVLEAHEDLPPEQRHRKVFHHTREMTLVRVVPEEMARVAEVIAERLNAAQGPTGIAIPLRGFSFPSGEGMPLYDPVGDRAFASTLKARLSHRIRYIEVDCHINDPPYAEAAVALLEDLMAPTRRELENADGHSRHDARGRPVRP